jgi:pimeloyl-ACP methyl ester carboxylesterase
VLKTKPDLATGEQGSLLLHIIHLQVDANHDGVMDPRHNGPDQTTEVRPLEFWLNDDRDRDNDEYIGPNADHADCRDDRINSMRDLEDFARLEIGGVPGLSAADGYSATLGWRPVYWGDFQLDTAPKIKLYLSAETDGGTAYLSDTNGAANQLYSFTYGTNTVDFAQSLGEISWDQSYQIPFFEFGGLLQSKFLFEGSGAGSGELVFTLYKDGEIVAESSQWITIKEVREMYEQTDITGIPITWPEMVEQTYESQYVRRNVIPEDPTQDKKLAVFVHGWRMTEFDYQSFSATMFKRLYWQGYQGRFASLRWPTRSEDTDPEGEDLLTFNRSEHIAFKSGTGTAAFLRDLRARFPDYTISVAAHSMGNIVMMQALKELAATNLAPIDNYVMMQAAVPAHSYDTTVTNLPTLAAKEQTMPTPNTYAGYAGNMGSAITGRVINFFNRVDYALATGRYTNSIGIELNTSWEGNQELFKPVWPFGYTTDGNISEVANGPFNVPLRPVTDPRELMPFIARSRAKAVGAEIDVGGVVDVLRQFDLENDLGFRRQTSDHSGQFNRAIQQPQTQGFYSRLRSTLFGGQP